MSEFNIGDSVRHKSSGIEMIVEHVTEPLSERDADAHDVEAGVYIYSCSFVNERGQHKVYGTANTLVRA